MDSNDLGVKATDNSVAQPDPIKANVDEEAKAEEAFVNDDEDAVFNPFVEDGDAAEEEEILTDADMEIPGAVGSGNLETVMPNDPVNNEETFSENVKMQDLQSDIDTGTAIDDEALPSAEETVKVNVGESMQPEEKPEVENTEIASQMDSLLNGSDVVENTTPETEAVAGATEAATPVADAPAEETTASSPVAEAVATNPVVDTATVATEAPAETTVQAATEPAKKKGGAGKIIAIVLILLLLIGGGIGAILYVNWHESKDKVVSDAMSKLFNIKLADDKLISDGNGVGVTKISGTTTVTPKEVEKYTKGDRYAFIESTVMSFDMTLNDVNTSVKGSMTANYTNGDSDKIGAEAVYLSGGKIFVKLGDLDNYTESLGSIFSGRKTLETEEEDDDDFYSFYTTEEPESVKEFNKKIEELVTSRISNKWIGVSNDTFKYLLGEENYHDEYSCITDGLEKSTKESKEKLLEAYKNHSFLVFGDSVENLSNAQEGLSYYEVSIDEDILKDFSKEVEKIDTAVDISKCFDSMVEEYTSGSTSGGVSQTKADSDEKKTSKDTVKYYFGVKPWSHEVRNIIIETETESTKSKSSYDLSYDAVKVEEPSDAKSVEKTAEEVYDAYIKLVDENMDAYLESKCYYYDDEYYGTSYAKACKEEEKAEFNEMKALSFKEYLKELQSSLFYDDDDWDIDNCGGLEDEATNCVSDWD